MLQVKGLVLTNQTATVLIESVVYIQIIRLEDPIWLRSLLTLKSGHSFMFLLETNDINWSLLTIGVKGQKSF